MKRRNGSGKVDELVKKRKELQGQFKSFDKNFNELKDIEHYQHNLEIERAIKKIDIALAMQNKEAMKPIQPLHETLGMPCALIGNEVWIIINEGVMRVIEENVGSHKYLFFLTRDMEFLYCDDAYLPTIEKIMHFYLNQTKKEEMESLILQYENLNNADIDVDLEGMGFERYEQDGEVYEERFQFIDDAPDLFWDHLPRGFYIHSMK